MARAPKGRIPSVDPYAPARTRRLASSFALSWPGRWFSRTIAARVDPWLLRATGGRLDSSFGALPVVLLTSRGARSRNIRHTPVLYFTDGPDVVLIASSFGRGKHPAWYHNLRAHPEVWLRRRGRAGAYRARTVSGSERQRLYALGARLFGGYDVYAKRTRGTREIPVLRLSPLSGGPANAGQLFAHSTPSKEAP